MWVILDSWWQNQAAELLRKLQQNLPLTILTTIVMSLIIGFWRKLLHAVKRHLGLVEPAKDPFRPAVPEGEFAHVYTLQKFHHGFTVGLGWRGVLIDAGVVQRELEPRRYRRRTMAKMIAKSGLTENAQVIIWRDREFPVVLFLKDLFASDHQPMQMDLHTIFKINPARLLKSSLEEITHPPEEIAEKTCTKISLAAQQWVSSMEAEEFYRHHDRVTEWADLAKSWIQRALDNSAFELVRITDLRLFSPALDQLYREYGELDLENEAAKREVERNKVRGALRQAVLSGKLEEMRDQAEHEDAVRVIEQERALKDKALRQELSQAEMQDLAEKVRVWKRKHELLLQVLDPANGGNQTNVDLAQRMTESFRRNAVEAANSPFSLHEREQIRTLLQSYQGQATRPEEILSAIAQGADIPCAVFDPLSRIRGSHTLRVGDGWRIFDGRSLWQIRLTRIVTRRHGFLWHHESPSLVHFEIRGAPDNRRFEQDVVLGKPFHFTAGPHEIPVDYLGGTPSKISLRIPQAAGGKPLDS
jgi:hypothetical protein